MRTLILDIETSPHKSFTWGLWDQNISLNQLIEASQVLCFAAKWHGDRGVMFVDNRSGQKPLAERAYELMDEAEAIVHYNGNTFDIPNLKRELLLAGLGPPSPHADIDLLTTVKKQFKFASNKLAYVVEALGLGAKADNEGMTTWIGCMADDEASWRLMRKYNIRDVEITESLYDRVLPWIKTHPNVALHDRIPEGCIKCGGTRLERQGSAFTFTREYDQYKCLDCGSWNRNYKSEGSTSMRSAR